VRPPQRKRKISPASGSSVEDLPSLASLISSPG
jgi:hypothetical protein